MFRLRLLIVLSALCTSTVASPIISGEQAADNVREFYAALKYTVTKGNINTDHDYKTKWINLAVEGAKLPNEPKKLNFLWNVGSGGNADFMRPSYYFDCYAKARDVIQKYEFEPNPKVVAAVKPDMKNAKNVDVQYYYVSVMKYMIINGHSIDIHDEVCVKADNGHISHIKNKYGGEIPAVLTTAIDGTDAIADADYQYTKGNHVESYRLYRKAVASSTLTKLDEADASYRLAVLLYYYSKDCEPNADRKEINRLISAFLTHASELGNWYIKYKVDKAIYDMENPPA